MERFRITRVLQILMMHIKMELRKSNSIPRLQTGFQVEMIHLQNQQHFIGII